MAVTSDVHHTPCLLLTFITVNIFLIGVVE